MIIEAVYSIKSFMEVFVIAILTVAIVLMTHQKWIDEVRLTCPGSFENNTWCNPKDIKADFKGSLVDEWNDLGYSPPEVPKFYTDVHGSFILSYLLSLGEFSFDDDGVLRANYDYLGVGWAIFTFATLVNFVIMCNLLISIFSGVHDVFHEVKEEEA
jgi:hypothetical protein